MEAGAAPSGVWEVSSLRAAHRPGARVEVEHAHVVERFLVRRAAYHDEAVADGVECGREPWARTTTARGQGRPVHRDEEVHVIKARLAVVTTEDKDLPWTMDCKRGVGGAGYGTLR